MGRRWRELFANDGEAPAADDLAHRIGADGLAALDHLIASTREFTLLGRALEQTLTEDHPVLHPAVADPAARTWGDATGTVEERLAELAWEADALADRAGRVTADEWGRAAQVAGHDATTSALGVLWDAVDSAVSHLQRAEQTLREVGGR